VEGKEAPKDKKRRRRKSNETSAQLMVKALDDAIGKIRKKLADEEMKSSIGDLARLMQMRHDLKDTQPRQVTVRWVDECQTTPATDE
jgi:hypothetical protein